MKTTDTEFRKTSLADVFSKAPLGFIDIGARGGIHETVNALAPFVSVLGFEPDPEECALMVARIEKHGSPYAAVNLEPVGLAGYNGTATLHRISVPTNDSLRIPNAELVARYNMVKWERIGELSVPVSMLDDVVFGSQQGNEHTGEMIKIDTQGTELEILKGGQKTLSERTVALIAEVSFAELYEGQGFFSEVEQYLRGLGFSFYGFDTFRLRSCNRMDRSREWSRERAFQADAIFFKDPLPGSPTRDVNLTHRQQHSLIVSAVLLEFYEFGLELVDAFIENAEDRKACHAWILAMGAMDTDKEKTDVEALAREVTAAPERMALAIGEFVDTRRHRSDVAKLLADKAALKSK